VSGSGSRARIVFGHAWRLVRRGALIWGAVFALVAISSIAGYESGYATAADRTKLAAQLTGSTGLQALFGQARAVNTVQGFVAWRCGGLVPVIAAVWGLLAATRLMRGEEEAGRWEILLAGAVTPGRAAFASLAALGAAIAAVWAMTAAAILAVGASRYGFPIAGSLYLALALVAAGAVFVSIGAVAAQLSTTRGQAAALAATVFGVALVLRMAADSSASVEWMRWLTPFGWVEELHPLTGAQPLVLVPIAALTAALGAAAVRLAGRRDLQSGFLPSRDRAPLDPRLLGSPAAQALRSARGRLVGWIAGVGSAAFLFALISKSVAKVVSGSVAEKAKSLGANIATAEGYIGLTFVFLIVAVCLYAASHVSAAREEESSGRLDELLSQPVGRVSWLTGRLAVALLCLTAVAATSALLGWAGSTVGGAGVAFGDMLQAAVNTVPIALLFLGIGTLAYGLIPRESGGIAFGSVAIAFLIEFVGATVKAPGWLLDISPFHHLAFVPGDSINVGSSMVMAGVGLAAAVAGVAVFKRRDIVGA
jgi:ABC-2 type transport system permease protein